MKCAGRIDYARGKNKILCGKTESGTGSITEGGRGEKASGVGTCADRAGGNGPCRYQPQFFFPFYDNTKGKTVTFVVQMDDEQGLLSDLLHIVAIYKANILTIHQSIPVNGVATLTLSVEVKDNTGNISKMVEEIEEQDGIHYVKIVSRE